MKVIYSLIYGCDTFLSRIHRVILNVDDIPAKRALKTHPIRTALVLGME
jgi:hypothetical protein